MGWEWDCGGTGGGGGGNQGNEKCGSFLFLILSTSILSKYSGEGIRPTKYAPTTMW